MGCDWIEVKLYTGVVLPTKDYPRLLLNLIKEWKTNNPGQDIIQKFSVCSNPEKKTKKKKISEEDCLQFFLGFNRDLKEEYDHLDWLEQRESFSCGSGCTNEPELTKVIGKKKWRITQEARKLFKELGNCELKTAPGLPEEMEDFDFSGLALTFHELVNDLEVPGPYEAVDASGSIIPVPALPLEKSQVTAINKFCKKQGIQPKYCLFGFMH